MVEAVCFEIDHRYVRSTHHEGYVCLKCRGFISLAEFEKRANKACSRPPIGVGQLSQNPLQASLFAEESSATFGGG